MQYFIGYKIMTYYQNETSEPFIKPSTYLKYKMSVFLNKTHKAL